MKLVLRLNQPNQDSATIRLAQTSTTLGRGPGCDIVLSDDVVSGLHARLIVEGGELSIVDLDSRNGVYVDDRQVTRQLLRCGQRFRLGEAGPEFEVVEFEPPLPPLTSPVGTNASTGTLIPTPARRTLSPPQQAYSLHSKVATVGVVATSSESASSPSARLTRRATVAAISLALLIAVTLPTAVIGFSLMRSPTAPLPPPSHENAVQKVMPSVVQVRTPRGFGSGFVVADPHGDRALVVTNFHVLAGNDSANVVFNNDQGTATPVAGFAIVSQRKDLIVLILEESDQTPRPIPLADQTPDLQEAVIAIGNPKGWEWSTTNGRVSAIRNGSDVASIMGRAGVGGGAHFRKSFDDDAIWLQSTAPIDNGNSGGPLVNLSGEVVGVNTWLTDMGHNNYFFAISAIHVREMLARCDGKTRPLSKLPTP